MDSNEAKLNQLLETVATRSDLAVVREEMATNLAVVREEMATNLAVVREEMATKNDLAVVREEMTTDLAAVREEMATKTDLAAVQENNRREHLELFVSIRTELRQELASHMGAIEETLSSKAQLILEAQQQFVRRDELAELLP